MTESRLLYFCKICCFMLLLSTSRFLFAAESVMVPSVSNEHFCLIDQIVQIQFGLLPKSKEQVVEKELKELSLKDTMAAVRFAMMIMRRDETESKRIWHENLQKLLQLAEKNNPQACLYLSMAYRHGIVVEKSSETASLYRKKFHSLRQAALLKNDPCSMLEEVILILQQQSPADARLPELLRKLQENGSITAEKLLKRMEKKQ